MTQPSKLQPEEEIAYNECRYTADKTAEFVRKTECIKHGAVERIEEVRLNVAASADTRRMELYLNALEHSGNLSEEERQQLDDILLDPSVLKNQGATAICIIETEIPHSAHHMTSCFAANQTNKKRGAGPKNNFTSLPYDSDSKTSWQNIHNRLRREIEHKRFTETPDENYDCCISTTTLQKVQSIQNLESARLQTFDRRDQRGIGLLNKIVMQENFQPRFLTQIVQELTPINALLHSNALQEIVNLQPQLDIVSDTNDDLQDQLDTVNVSDTYEGLQEVINLWQPQLDKLDPVMQ